MAVDAWGQSGPVVLHVSGTRDYDQLVGRVARPDYTLMAETDQFGDLLAAADLAVSRAGGTVWELAAAGMPAILVPYPHATADHQMLNARHFERGGGAIVVPDAELGRVPALVAELLADPERLGRMREAMLAMARPEAAERIADGLFALARGARPMTLDQRRRASAGPPALLRRDRRLGPVGLREHRAGARRRGARLGSPGHDLHARRSVRSRWTSAASPTRRPGGR